MKRVLMIGQMSIVGGQQAFMMNYFRHIDKSRFHIDFLGVHGNTSPYQQEIEKCGSNLYYWNKTFGPTELISSLFSLVEFLKKGNYDVVHSNIYLGNCWFLVAAKIAGVKIRISHSHCSFPLYEDSEGWFLKKYHSVIQKQLLLLCATHYFACGEMAGRALYGNKDFVVMKNGIDVNSFYNIPQCAIDKLREEFAISKNIRVFASISRFDKNKNLAFAVNLFQKIHIQIPDSILIIGGAEPYEDSTHHEIEDLVESLHLEDAVRIVGTRNDLPILMKLVHCWLFPSFHEGLPIVGIELQAASVRILASNSITREMDMGLGLVSYLPLNNASLWLDKSLLEPKKIGKEDTVQAFIKRGYCIDECVTVLEKYYSDGSCASKNNDV